MQHWRKNRAPTRYSVTLLVGQTPHRVTIINVNEDGAGLQGLPPLARGVPVTVQFLHHRIPAKVAWCQKAAGGVTFQTRLGAPMLGTLRRLVGQRGR